MSDFDFVTKKDLCRRFGVAPATIDRWRDLPGFPLPIEPTGAERSGKLRWMWKETLDWFLGRRRNRPDRSKVGA